jgi:hypothetical protein
MTLQAGERPSAYRAIHDRVENYLREHGVDTVVVKESALPPGGRGVTKALLESAEVRGVVVAAAASVSNVRIVSRATLSRTFGDRTADEYLNDDTFWSSEMLGMKARAFREAALIVLAVARPRVM